MFTVLMAALGEALLWIGGLYVVYRIVFHKSLNAEVNFKQAKAVAEKLALVKLHSKSSKDILLFLENNAQYLSEAMINKLADVSETLKAEEDLNDKFSALESRQRVSEDEVAELEDETHNITKTL